MRRNKSRRWAQVFALSGTVVALITGVPAGDVEAADDAKPSKEAQALAIESRLIDLQVQAGVLKSLQMNAQPVDTGVLAERQTTPVAPGRQDTSRIARIDDEVRRLSASHRQLTGRGAGILPDGTEARQPADGGAMMARAAQPLAAPAAVPSPGAGEAVGSPSPGGWSGTTTVSPSHGGQVNDGGLVANGVGGWGGQAQASPWQQGYAAGGGMPAGAAPAPQGANGHAGGAQSVPSQGSFGGWGDTSGGRVGEVLPPGVPYPGTESGQHDQALASLDQARRQSAPRPSPQAALQAPGQPQAGGTGLEGADAAYEQAYRYLLEQDYGAAQFAFQEFLTRHGENPLAGNAQYWLGEIHFVQGKYREAARAFLTGYEKYGDGHKAAESLFKLALSLEKLNQPQAACSSLSEFFKRYGRISDAPVERATEARQRLRCQS
jgi:tol-pal system protein YbgF